MLSPRNSRLCVTALPPLIFPRYVTLDKFKWLSRLTRDWDLTAQSYPLVRLAQVPCSILGMSQKCHRTLLHHPWKGCNGFSASPGCRGWGWNRTRGEWSWPFPARAGICGGQGGGIRGHSGQGGGRWGHSGQGRAFPWSGGRGAESRTWI